MTTNLTHMVRHSNRVVMATLSLSVVACIVMSVTASQALAAGYEQVATFGGVPAAPVPAGNFPEEAQLGGANAIAVNIEGNGGVDPGTLYAADWKPGGVRVVRFSKEGDFELAWEGTTRCGPALGTTCAPLAEGTEKAAVDVEIDQATGNVYVFTTAGLPAGTDAITEYNADGTQVIATFAQIAGNGETVPASPSKIHGGYGIPGAIAVSASGTVYVYDTEPVSPFRYRLMMFKPETPGDFAHYKYAGDSTGAPHGEISPGEEVHGPSRPVLDDEGNVFVAGEGYVEKFSPSAASPTPLCSFQVKDGGARGMAVNPETGEVYFYDYKDREIHQLDGNCGVDGRFTEVQSFGLTPERAFPQALAVNPTFEFDPGRHGGTVYAAAPNGQNEVGGGQLGAGGLGYIFAQAITEQPRVEGEFVSNVTASSVKLHGVVKPGGLTTEYSFEYITQAGYEANSPSERFAGAFVAPAGGAVLSRIVGSVPVAITVAGLAPDTAYRFRLVASNELGVGVGEAESFTTFPLAPGLPDGRAYELVSPPDKSGGEVFPAYPTLGSCNGVCKPGGLREAFPVQSSPDGTSIAYEGSAFEFADGALAENEYIARRTDAGWQTSLLSPAQQTSSAAGYGFRGIDRGLTAGILNQQLPALTANSPSDYPNLYRITTTAPSAMEPLLTQKPPNRPPGVNLKLAFAGASADFSRVFFSANDALTKETPFAPAAKNGGANKTNLYEWSGGELRLVNVLPKNTSAPAGAVFGGIALTNAISADGSRAFWSSESGQVYVRLNGETTKEIATAGVPDPGRFLTASVSGARVLLENGHLHDIEGAESTTDLTGGQGGFAGIVGQSEDLSHIYFVATAVLTGSEKNQMGQEAEAGAQNLYSWIEGSTSFIARLAPGNGLGDAENWRSVPPGRRTAEASPNGRWLAFQSVARLTSYDNTGPCLPAGGGYEQTRCKEVYLYDANAARFWCVSCNPTGEAPLGPSLIPTREAINAAALPQMRYLTDAGRLYFDSQDRLSAADTNGRTEDVYQVEPAGVGSCTRSGGCVSLISSGRSATDSNFLTIDESGDDIFFTTRSQLVASDMDGLMDLYDARVGGAAVLVTPPVECSGEACQQVQTVPPESSPATGAVKPEAKPGRTCKKGQKKKHGRCVKKQKHHKKSKKANKRNRGGK